MMRSFRDRRTCLCGEADGRGASSFTSTISRRRASSSWRTTTAKTHINVGTGEDLSINELAGMIRDVVYPQARIVFDASRPDGPPRKLLDVSQPARSRLDAEPLVTFGNRIDLSMVPRPSGRRARAHRRRAAQRMSEPDAARTPLRPPRAPRAAAATGTMNRPPALYVIATLRMLPHTISTSTHTPGNFHRTSADSCGGRQQPSRIEIAPGLQLLRHVQPHQVKNLSPDSPSSS